MRKTRIRMLMANIIDNKQTRWLLFWIVVILAILILPYIQTFASGTGGYISEKLINRNGIASSDLTIDRSGVASSTQDIGIGAIVTTLEATNIRENSTTLNGRLSDMNSMPQAIVYFEWGYDTSYGNTTTSQTLTGIGNFSISLSGYDSRETVYFRAISKTDGILYGTNQTFTVGGRFSAYNVMRTALLSVIAVAITILCFAFMISGNWVAGLIATIIGIIAFAIVHGVLFG